MEPITQLIYPEQSRSKPYAVLKFVSGLRKNTFAPENLFFFLLTAVISAITEEVEVPESKPAGVYRPPGARLTTTKRVHNPGPPEIFSDAQFPSLLSTAKHVETRK